MLLFLCSILSLLQSLLAADCTLLPPLEGATGSDLGFIMIPGAQIPGERYHALVNEIQKKMPGARVWAGVTRSWLANFPNPIEIAGAIQDCIALGEEAGLGGPIFMGGHSLGGIMLKTYVEDHPDIAAGIVLFGSYLPDIFGDHSNEFPVPVLTAVGTLDGMTLAYVYREWLESRAAEEASGMDGRYPVVAVEWANHAQVADDIGEIPSFVTEQDIESPISFNSAHERYASVVSAFIILQQPSLFTDLELTQATIDMFTLQGFTEEFLQPFAATQRMERDPDSDPETSWNFVMEAQKAILKATEEELRGLATVNFQVPESDLGNYLPSLESSSCTAEVRTFSTPLFEFNPQDAGGFDSSTVIKAKMKLEDEVRASLCLPTAERGQCKDANIKAFETALDLASDEARERYVNFGTQIVFGDDELSGWNLGWEWSSNLHWSSINDTHTRLHSTALVTESDFFIGSAAGMHYCDLLSPYRAIEWIYIMSLQGKSMDYTNFDYDLL